MATQTSAAGNAGRAAQFCSLTVAASLFVKYDRYHGADWCINHCLQSNQFVSRTVQFKKKKKRGLTDFRV